MDKLISTLQVIVPIFTVIFLGVFARRKNLVTAEGVNGLQQFVMNFCLPCVLFNSCLGCSFGAESVTSFALLVPALLCSSLLGFRLRKNRYPYHNFPFLFTAQESGMLGIPLFMTLFGAEQAYRMGILDMGQAFIAIPVLALLSASPAEDPTPLTIVKRVFRSPLLIMSLLALALNLTGCAAWLDRIGIGGIITETTGFLAAPVSAVMLFSVGYNFSLGDGNRSLIFRICALHLAVIAVICGVLQAVLFLVPAVDVNTRWAILLYCALPTSFLTPSLGRNAEDAALASGVCSVLTVLCLAVFCVMAVIVA